jgi:hypothetical protein
LPGTERSKEEVRRVATHWQSILGHATLPDTSGNVFWEPYSVKATNDQWRHGVWIFNDTATRLLLYGQFVVPQNYVGSAKVYPVWTSTATTGNVVWDFDYRTVGGDDTTSLDQAGTEEALTVTDAAPTAAHRRLTPSMTPTAGNFSAGETVEFLLARDGANASDTMAAAVILFDLLFEYADA